MIRKLLEKFRRPQNSSEDNSAIKANRLEPRIMYSAVPGAELLVDAAVSDAAVDDVDSVSIDEQLGDLLASSDGDMRLDVGDQVTDQLDQLLLAFDEEASVTELVVIDKSVEGYEELVADIRGQEDDGTIELVFIEPDEDGIEKLTQVLAKYQDLEAVHIVSHGTDGRVQLGNASLSSSSLESYAGDISAWESAFTEDADILFYGCNLAESESGRDLLADLAAICDCDFAASDDLTGSESMGGDWELEYVVGTVNTDVVFSSSISDWSHVLESVELTAAKDTYLDKNFDQANFGDSTTLLVNKSGGDVGDGRTLLEFDLSGIPAGATINSVTLSLNAISNTAAFNINVYEVTEAWDEGTADGTTDAASWKMRTDTLGWSVDGGVYDPTIIDTSYTWATGEHTWDVTSLVQDWIDGIKVNNGLMLASPDGGGETVVYQSAESGNGPKLIIDYEPAQDLEISGTAAGGLSLNEDGGNDAYLEADDGSAIFGGLQAMTLEAQFSSTQLPAATGSHDFLSYVTTTDNNEIRFAIDYVSPGVYHLEIWLDGTRLQATSYDADQLFDGEVHSVGATWSSTLGSYEFFVDGVSIDSGVGFKTGYTIESGGSLMVARDHDTLSGGFVDDQHFSGTLHDIRVFDDVRSAPEILANHDADLAYDEPNLVANWKFNELYLDEVTGDQIVTDTVSGNNLTLRNVGSGLGFVSSTPLLTLLVDENESDGFVVGQVTGTDLERTDLINTLLASDPDLVYNAETGKFYKVVTTATNWTDANSQALVTNLNGIGGQLATIRNAAENAVVTQFAIDAGQEMWIGASDSVVDGEWYWYEDGVAADQFWQGDFTGSSVNGAFTDWQVGRPDNAEGGIQDYLSIRPTGEWNDEDNADPSTGYIIEWNVDDVLDNAGPVDEQPVIYSISGQTVSGAFAIDADNGEITVADGTLLDYETNSLHTVTVRVTDVDGNFNEKDVTIALVEKNDAPVIVLNAGTTLTEGFSTTITNAMLDATDQDDVDSGLVYTVTSVPSAGLLKLNGTTLNANDTFTQGDIDSGLLTYEHDGSEDPTDGFDFSVADGGEDGASPATGTFVFTINGVNEQPVFTGLDGNPSYTEDGPAVVLDSNVTLTDPELSNIDNFDGSTLTLVRNGGASTEDSFSASGLLSPLTQGGNLTFGGTVIGTVTTNSGGMLVLTFNSNATNALVNSTMQSIAYSNSNQNPSGSVQVDWTFEDQNSGAQGSGGNLSATGSTTVDLIAVNDDPYNSGLIISDYSVAEDTLTAIDVSAMNLEDIDASSGNLTLKLNTNTGGNLYATSGGGVTVTGSGTSSLTLTGQLADLNSYLDDPSQIEYLHSVSGTNGNDADQIDFSINDNGNTGIGGGTDILFHSLNIDILAVNDAPVVAAPAIALEATENVGLNIHGAGFAVTDIDEANLGATATLTVGDGYLTIASGDSGVSVDSGNGTGTVIVSGTIQEINDLLTGAGTGTIVYQNDDDTPVASTILSVTVNDQGNVGADPGISGDATSEEGTNSQTINITAVNDAPTAANNTVATNEDTVYTFGAGDFNFSDIEGDSLASIQITSLESVGTLQLNGVDVTLNQVISRADIDAGLLTFLPAADANGAGHDSFGFTVNDGLLDSVSSYTLTVDVAAVNDAPTAANNTVATNEDTVYTFGAGDFSFSDIEGDSLASIQITSLESVGTLQLNGVDVTLNQVISRADIDSGLLTFLPAADANGTGHDSFGFTVNDGLLDSVSSYTLTVDVAAVNDAPVVASPVAPLNATENSPLDLHGIGFSVTDVDESGLGVSVTVSVGEGYLTVVPGDSGVVVVSGNGTSALTLSGNISEINNLLTGGGTGTFQYQNDNDAPSSSTMLSMTVNDNGNVGLDPGSTGDGSSEEDTVSLAINVSKVNDAPINSVPALVSVAEETATPVAGISISDPDGTGTLTTQLQVGQGVLNVTLSGSAIISSGANGSADLTISGSEADINATLASLTYTGDTNVFGVNADTITVTTNDQGNEGSGGALTDVDSVQVDIIGSQDKPISSDSILSINEDQVYVLQATDFPYADSDGDPLAAVQITGLPVNGALELSGVLVNAGDIIAVGDINSGLLTYTPVNDGNGVGFDGFGFRVGDGTEFSDATSQISIINATFDSNSEGFVYADDVFGTSQPANADGTYDGAGGFSGGGLSVSVGGNTGGASSSGGWSQTFNVTEDTIVQVSLRYRLDVAIQVDSGEFGEAILEIDGVRYGSDLNGSLSHIEAGGDSGWQIATIEVALTAGSHTLTLGAFANSTDQNNETVDVFFDDVQLVENSYQRMDVDVAPVNDAPVLDNSSSLTLTSILEDDTSSSGDSVAQILASAGGDPLTDVDAAPVEGIAIVGVDNTNGTWEYSLDGITWNSISGEGVATSGTDDTNALTLDASAFIRFVPNADFNGNAGDIQFRGWDQTDGSVSGDSGVDVSTNGGTSAYSTQVESATLDVTPVNDAPVLGANSLSLLEGESVVLTTSDLNASDVDNATSTLTYQVSNVSNGRFELATNPQVAISSFKHSDLASGLVVFVHDGSETPPSYDVTVTDGLLSDGPFAASISFTNVNNAPVIQNLGGDASIAFNDGTPTLLDSGVAVSLFDPESAPDFDGGTLVVSGNSFDVLDQLGFDTSGTISLSAGYADGSLVQVSGIAIGTLSGVSDSGFTITFNSDSTSARVEEVIQAIQFQSTSSTLGGRSVDLTFNDGDGVANGGDDTSPTATVSISVAQFGNGLVATDEDVTYTFSATDFDFSGTVSSNLEQITIKSLPVEGQLQLGGVAVAIDDVITKAQIDAGLLEFVPDANENGPIYASFDFVINSGNGSVTVLAGEPNYYTLGEGALVKTDEILADTTNFGIGGTYQTSINVIDTESDIDSTYLSQGQVLFNGWVPDGNLTTSELSNIDSWVQSGGILISTNDGTGHDDLATYYGLTIGGTGSSTWLVEDPGHAIMDGPFGQVGAFHDPFRATGMVAYFDSASLSPGDIVLATDSVAGEPTVVLRQLGDGFILFTSDEGIFRANMTGGGAITTANDILAANVFAWAASQVPASQSHTMDISVNAVNDDPFNTGTLPTDVSAVEDVLSSVDLSGINLQDIDSGTGDLTLTLSTGSGGTLSATTAGGIIVGGSGTGVLTLTGTQADLNAYLDNASNVQFLGANNVNGNNADSIHVEVSDNGNIGSGGGGDISLGTINVDIAAVNDDPFNIGSPLPSSVSLIEDTPNDFDLSALDLSDVDVQTGNLTLTLTSSAGATFSSAGGGGVSVAGDGTSTLQLTGSLTDLNAFINVTTNVQITGAPNAYGANSDQVTVTINDNGNTGLGGGGNVVLGLVGIDITPVNDVAVISNLEPGNLGYTENDGPVQISSTLQLSDVDDPYLESAVVQISGNYVYGEDVLAFVDTANITAVWDAVTGTLTLTGSDTVANYEAAIRSVTYENVSEDPSNLDRTLSIHVNDGDVDSAVVTRDITVIPVNDEAVLSGLESTDLTYDENDGQVVVSSAITISDVDDTQLESAVVRIAGGYVNGEDILDFVDTASISGSWDPLTGTLTLTGTDSVANYQLALQSITYENISDDPSTVTRSVEFIVNDGDNDSSPVSRDVVIVAYNDAPTISGIETGNLTYMENDGPQQITSTLSLSDLDDVNLESAVVRIAGNYVPGEDQLLFTNTAGITGVFDSTTGTLTLTGTDSVANYEAALRSIAYENTSENPSGLSRQLEFVVNDGGLDSAVEARIIDVIPVNDAPVTSDDGPFTVDESSSLTLNPLSNDLDYEGDSMSITEVNGLSLTPGGPAIAVTGGTIELQADGETLTFTPSPNFFGNADFVYTVTDGNGEYSNGNVLVNIVDTTAPDSPYVTILDDVNDDGFINIAEQIGTVEYSIALPVGALEGETLDINGSQYVLTAGDVAAGFVNGSLPAPAHNDVITLSVFLFDPAGNLSATSTDSVIVDLVAPDPSAPLDLIAASDTGISNNDNYTGDLTPTLRLPIGTGVPGDLVTLYSDGIAVGTGFVDSDGSATVSATITGFTIQKLTYTFTDQAGNEGDPSIGLFIEFFDDALPYQPPTDPNILGVEKVGDPEPVITPLDPQSNDDADDDREKIPFDRNFASSRFEFGVDTQGRSSFDDEFESADLQVKSAIYYERDLDGSRFTQFSGDLNFRVASTHLDNLESYDYQMEAFLNRLSELADDNREDYSDISLFAGTATASAGVVIAGYALWVVRAAFIASWFATSIPAFSRFDPLMVLDESKNDKETLAQIAKGKSNKK